MSRFITSLIAALIATSFSFPVKFKGSDCGASGGHYQSADVVPAKPRTGQVFKVSNHFTFDQDISGGNFDVKVHALGGIPLKHQTGPLCGFDTSYDVYLAVVKVASVTVYGMDCPIAKGPADIKYDIKLASILPPALGDASFHFTAKDSRGNDVACLDAKLAIQLEDTDAENEEAAEAVVESIGDTVGQALMSVQDSVGSSNSMLSLTWSDCGSSGKHAKIVDFSPLQIGLGEMTTMTGHGQLDEDVASAKYELSMTGAIGTLLHCTGDASQPKACPLPMGFGSLTMKPMAFPMSPGLVPVSVDIDISSSTPTMLQTTDTVAKAFDQNGEEIFCMKIHSAPASATTVHV